MQSNVWSLMYWLESNMFGIASLHCCDLFSLCFHTCSYHQRVVRLSTWGWHRHAIYAILKPKAVQLHYKYTYRLHHTVHCAEKIVSVRCTGSASAERAEQGEVGGVTCRVWWLLGLAAKGHGWDRVGYLSSWLHGQAWKHTTLTL